VKEWYLSVVESDKPGVSDFDYEGRDWQDYVGGWDDG